MFVTFDNPEVEYHNTYISYDLLSLIGEVGGILGLTLGMVTHCAFRMIKIVKFLLIFWSNVSMFVAETACVICESTL